MKKKLLALITGAIVASTIITPVAGAVTVQAAQTGWVRSGNNWRYYGKDGKAYTGWHWMTSKESEKTPHWSYFGNDGNLRTGWVQLGKGTKEPDGNTAKHWSYFGGNGWLRTGWIKLGKGTSEPDGNTTPHWSYFGGNGWLRTGWIKLGKGTSEPDGNTTPHWSYFGDNGWLREGWQQLGKGTNNPDGNTAKHWSYFGGNGWLRTGLQYMGKGTGNPDGNAAKHMSYFGDNGWLVVNKELNISGNRFKADSKGWLTQMMKVIFMDGLGNEISTQYVEKGKKATPPENPTRSGYEFDGWDKSYNNITAYTTIIAKWKAKSTQSAAKTYTVTFKNGNSTITTQTVKAGASAKAPANPSKTGYTFAGWDKNFTNVKKDLTVNAKWDINTYKVVFTDGQGKTLKTQTVQYGKSASAPDDPIRSGYTFAGWDRSYDNVKGNLTVNAKWKENVAPAPAVKTYTVEFISEDTLLKTETVESGKAATAPPDPTRYFYSDIYNYKFVGWDKKFDKITQDTTVTALWEENKLQYKYDVKFVTQPYADTDTPVFVETDNPDPESFTFSFLKADGSENELWLAPTRYDDLSYDTPGPGSIGTIGTLFWCDGSMAGSHGKKVPGGYFYTIRMEDPGEMIIKVREHTTVGSTTFTIAEENIGRITVKDYYEELDKWADEVISKVSKGSNSKQEQMRAITNYLRSTAKYRKCYIDKNGNTQYLTLATEYGLPIWETNEWTSYTSPSFLCYFGDKIGYPLHNMYYDYERGTEEWSRYHMYAKSIEDGTMYEFCSMPSTNLLKDIHSEDDVKKIDFLTYNNYYRMTPIN